ncbi:MAG: iron-only hydrogenase system regulator [Candidatus Omnitrophica bacterium]|nr:iron-only hydrogenase system regulator [Candidatus Omnitrophota bacterium]MBU4478585.1 iron-only hydrogenase system regulator [Candidatus Omnitrophota bacterium]
MSKRIGFVGIIVEERKRVAQEINKLLSDHGDIIVGRMGIPYEVRGCSVITLVVDATTDELGCLTGKLGQLNGVLVKSALAKK